MAHNPLAGDKRKKRIISSVAIGVALIAALGLGVWVRTMQTDTASEKKGSPATTQPPVTEAAPSAETKQVQDLLVAGKTDEANTYVTQQLAKPDLSNQQKYDLHMGQGDIAFNQSKYDVALSSYQKAEAVEPGYTVSLLVARSAARANNKDVAIAYYKKAIERMDKNSPLYKDDKASIETKIKDLGGTL